MRLILTIIIFVISVFYSVAFGADSREDVYVYIESDSVRYVIGETSIPGNGFMEYLSRRSPRINPRTHKLRIILPQHASFASFFGIRGFMHKVGFGDMEFYVSSSDGHRMIRIDTAGQPIRHPNPPGA